MEYIISLALIALSALFSGLTLGLLSLDVHALKRQKDLGDKDATIVYEVRKNGNLLLTTLLFGNVAVNTTLSVFLGTIASGVVAGVTATALILIFGEIIPQAVISRYALWFGARTAWIVKILIALTYPITFPIAFVLDRFLGAELPTIYTKHELMQIISEHEDSDESQIDADEERILHGALQFSHMRVHEAMTPADRVVAFACDRVMDGSFREELLETGFSRYPIYRKQPDRIVGILYSRSVLAEDEDTVIEDAEEAFDDSFLKAKPSDFLDILLTRMLRRKQHIAIVLDDAGLSVGVITLEDIIEEIIQHEIEDEGDAEG